MADDPRPPVWIGHVALPAGNVAQSTEHMVKLGLRPIFQSEEVSVLELRGGTHLVLLPSDDPVPAGSRAPFDLMVEDLDASWKEYQSAGLDPGEIARGKIHDSFTVVAPSGHEITINSSHVSDKPV